MLRSVAGPFGSLFQQACGIGSKQTGRGWWLAPTSAEGRFAACTSSHCRTFSHVVRTSKIVVGTPAKAGNKAATTTGSVLWRLVHTSSDLMQPGGTPFRPSTAALKRSRIEKQPPKPEDLYPDSFPKEGELVNPSGRIYSVRRSPVEDEEANAVARRKLQQNAQTMSADEVQAALESAALLPIEETRKPPILRAIAVTLLISFAAYSVAAIYSAQETQKAAVKIGDGRGIFGDFSSFFGSRGNDRPPAPMPDVTSGSDRFSEPRLRAARAQALSERYGRRLNNILGWCDTLGLGPGAKKAVARTYVSALEG